MKGYIKDYRKELYSDIWLMPPLYHRVWQYLKYMVNHKGNEIPMTDGTKLLIKSGQHLTSIRNIAKSVGWYEGAIFKEPNPKTIAKVIDWLEKMNMISIDKGRGNRQYTLITLLNWDLYQEKEDEGNSKVTASGQGREQQVDINKNEKNEKNEKKKDTPKRVYEETSTCYILADHFYNCILENNAEYRKPNLQKWANDIRLMMEVDKRNEEQIRYLIEWVQNDDFEMSNVLSPSKLRTRFDQLILKVKKAKGVKPKQKTEKPKEKEFDENDRKELLKLWSG